MCINDSCLSSQEIKDIISGHLDGDAHELWVGYDRHTKNEFVEQVQREETTIEEVVKWLYEEAERFQKTE